MKIFLTLLLIMILVITKAIPKIDTVALSDVVKVETASNYQQTFESPFTNMKYLKGARFADALGEYSSVYIKKYGAGQLASIAIRGTSATQTEVQWNGIRINPPSLGQVDLSLFHFGMQDELRLVRTGNRGIIGGTLMMNNELKIDSGISVSGLFRAASFKTFETMSDLQYAKGFFSGSTRFNYLVSANNFTYRNNYEANHPLRRQNNAAIAQLSFLQQLGFRLNKTNHLNLYCWFTDASREIAPIMSKPTNKEKQEDGSLRIMADWKGRFKHFKLKLSSAYLSDRIRYVNPDALLYESSYSKAIRNNFSLTYISPFQLILNTELNYDYETADVRAYGKRKSRNIAGIKAYADYYLLSLFRIHGGFRQDLTDNKLSAFAPELSFSYSQKFNTSHRFTTGWIASRNFRFPTLNDLYWTPGGNRDLKQERSWNGELHLKYEYRKTLDFSFSNFYLYASDWIQWTPQGSIWTPANLKRVFSRGIEANFHATNEKESRPNRFTFHLNLSYSFTRTTNLDVQSEFDASKGKQLIYVPLHQAVVGVELQYRKFYLRSVNHYTDKVYTSTDNSQSLKGYFISDLELGKDFALPHLEIGFSLRMNNLGGSSYQVVAQRPMPGRNYEGTFRFKFS